MITILKCGLEIHQQLEGNKLFCRCPTELRDEQPHFIIRRKLRAAAGEEGEIDIAAQLEQQKGKTIVYQGYHDTTCLVETDSEPPHELNQKALYTVLQFCQMVHADVVPVMQVMRKTIVDGSAPSGFQRTALVARNGYLETSQGRVHITNINLEEDACREIHEGADVGAGENEVIFRLDRVGIPLIEIGTAPDITTPQQALEAAKKIGMLLRSLPGVKRGLGTIRQDVNVSIPGGARIEIKGAQELKLLPLLVELEVKRQQELLRMKEELKGMKLNALAVVNLSQLLKNSSSNIIKKTIQQEGVILGLKLTGFARLLGRELQPKYRLGTEFAGRAKVIAGVGGIFHSDELPNYGITEEEVAKIRKELKCTAQDAFVLVANQEEKARLALQAVHQRAQEVLQGIPGEVRKANPEGTTSFLRPMPGAARMYPETDVPLIRPETGKIEVPELLDAKMLRYQQKLGLSKDLAEFVAKSDKVHLFEELVKKYSGVKPAYIAETLTSTLLDIKRQYFQDPDKLQDDDFRKLFDYLEQGKIHKDIVLNVLIDMCKGNFDLKYYEGMSTEELHVELKKIIAGNKEAPFSALMGMAVKKLRGRASGEKISKALNQLLREGHGVA